MNINKYKWAACLALASLVFTGCEKDDALDANRSETVNESSSDTVKDGYFTATLMPGIGNDMQSRAAIDDTSDRIQTLRFMLFKKGDDGVYTRFTDLKDSNGNNVDENIIKYTPNANRFYKWPFEKFLQLSLPVGDYKVVFFGNMDIQQFDGQNSEEIIQLNSGRFEDVRINMPVGGPLAFLPTLNSGNGQYQNLFYLATADFNQTNPNPQILLQRLVTQSTFSRDFIDTDDAVGKLAQSIVDQVNDEQLLSDIVEGVLRTELTGALTGDLAEGLVLVDVVDALVNVLLGDILILVNDALLQQVTGLLKISLLAGGTDSPLYTLLNPWSKLTIVNASMDIVTSIDLNRVPQSIEHNKLLEGISLNKSNNKAPYFTVTLLNGTYKLNSARVTDNKDQTVLRSALGALDNSLLAGLFINLCTPISYETKNNLQYRTNYDLLRLKLVDDTYSQTENITVEVDDLKTIINVEGLTNSLLGHGLLGNLTKDVIEKIVDPVVKRLLGEESSLLKNIGIKLPNLELRNITLEGRWGMTKVSDGTVAVSQIGERVKEAAWQPATDSSTASGN